jgi:hypothetical protein
MSQEDFHRAITRISINLNNDCEYFVKACILLLVVSYLQTRSEEDEECSLVLKYATLGFTTKTDRQGCGNPLTNHVIVRAHRNHVLYKS